MALINCEINLILACSENHVISSPTGTTKFAITDTKRYVHVVTLSTQDNIKLLKQLESDFERIINWSKYQSKVTEQAQNRYLDYLVDPSFQGVNKRFVLSFENRTDREVNTGYFLPKVEIKDYNVMIDGRNFFDQPIRNDQISYDNVQKIANGQEDDYTTVCLLDYLCFKENYKIIAIDLSKQQELDADRKGIQ